jgi:hypothetical protein
MTYLYLNAKLIMDMLCQVLSGIHTTVLSTRTTERKHQVCEAALKIAFNVCISQAIHGIQEGQDFTVVLKETDNRFIQTGYLLVRLIASRVVSGTAVENITASIAALVVRNAFAV